MAMEKVFKIRDPRTGLFSTGGVNPKFTKKGKTWNRLNHVKCHITQVQSYKANKDFYYNFEIVEFELVETDRCIKLQ